MKDARGFTLIEVLVAAGLMAMVVASAVSFFMYQRSHGRYAVARQSARQDISLATIILRQDIMHAGLGLDDKTDMAFVLGSKNATPSVEGSPPRRQIHTANSRYRELYINYGQFLTEDATNTNAPNIFENESWFEGEDKHTKLIAGITNTDLNMQQVEFLIGRSKVFPTVSVVSLVSVLDGLLTAVSPLSSTFWYTPAVSYRLEVNDSSKAYDPVNNPYTKLLRNGEVILGGDRNFRVIDFLVRAMFTGSVWSPDPIGMDSNKDFDNPSMDKDNLRMLEVTIVYETRSPLSGRTKKSGSEWEWRELWNTYQHTMFVTPRTVVLTQY